MYCSCYLSPLGPLAMESDGRHLTGLHWDDRTDRPDENLPVFRETVHWLDQYFAGKDPGELPPVLPEGTPFQQTVWSLLLRIPYGSTVAYGEIAGAIARQRGIPVMSAQAIGGAVHRNPIAILIPCHRVIGSSGHLTGYGGGMERKLRLLELEKLPLSGLFVSLPKKELPPHDAETKRKQQDLM